MDLENKIAVLEAEVAALREENQRLRESNGGGSAVVVGSLDTVDTVASKIHARWRRIEHVPGVHSWKKLTDAEFTAWSTSVDKVTLDRFYRHAPGETEPDLTPSSDGSTGDPPVHWVDIDQTYDTLPERWKETNRKQAQVEIDLRDAAAAKMELIELEAARVHDDWRRKQRRASNGERTTTTAGGGGGGGGGGRTASSSQAAAAMPSSSGCWKRMSHEEFEVWKKEVLPHDAAMLETHHRFATGKTAPEEDVVVSESSSDDSSSSGGGVHWCDIDMPYSVLPRKWKEANRTPAKTLVDAQDARSVAPQATVNASGQVKRLELIGSGTTSRVYKGVDSRSGRFIAAKVMHFASSDVKRKGHLQRMKDEIDVLSQISSCPNVVRYLGAAVNLGMCELEVFSEYCGGGSVQAILDGVSKGGVASRGDGGGGGSGLSEDTAKRYASDALSGLVYLHQLEPPVIHGDIKAANVLVSSHGVCKLADFGASYRWSRSKKDSRSGGGTGDDGENDEIAESHSRAMVGTPYFMSPEVISGNDVGPPVDIWSFGGFVLHMVTGRPPYRCCKALRTHFKLFSYIMRPDADNPLQAEYRAAALSSSSSLAEADAAGATPPTTFTPPSPPLEDFLTQSFTKDFKVRPSARDLQDLPWIAQAAWEPAAGSTTEDTAASGSVILEIETELKKLE